MTSPLVGALHRVPRAASAAASKAPLVAFEHDSSGPEALSTLLFLGGLTDGLCTVPYVADLASRLPPGWHLVEPVLGSSYRQWGLSSLDDDVLEISDLVAYFRSRGDKVVLLGHSTGCQDIMRYLTSPLLSTETGRPKIDGALLQAGVSDREALTMLMSEHEYEDMCVTAQAYMDAGKGKEILPLQQTEKIFGGSTPINAQRLLSVASPGPDHLGDDDYFSSDLDDRRLQSTFGKVGKSGARIAFIYGEKDEFVPLDRAGRQKLVSRFEKHVRDSGGIIDSESGILPGASHNLKEGGVVVDELARKVKGFLSRVGRQV